MIKILFVVSHLFPGGPNKQLLYLCKNIDRNLIDPLIITTSQNEFEGSLHNEFKSNNVEVIDLKLNKVKSIIFAENRIQRFINSRNIKILLSYGFRSDIITSDLKKVHKITSVRNTLMFNWTMTWGNFLGRLFGNINLYHIRKFDYVIACSGSVSKYLETINLDTITIRNSIDFSSNFKKYSASYENQKYLFTNPIKFITVSSQLKGKNIEFLLEAFVRNPVSAHELHIAGYVTPKLIVKYKRYQNIFFLGNVDNMNEIISKSDYFISASLHEGMPNAVLEALAIGVPVVLSDIPPHQEILAQSSSRIGAIFKNNSFHALCESIDEIINLDNRELRKNCIETIEKKFSAVVMAQEYKELFKSIVGSNVNI